LPVVPVSSSGRSYYSLFPIPYPYPLSVGRHLDDTITQEGIDYIEERCPGFNRRRDDEDREVSA